VFVFACKLILGLVSSSFFFPVTIMSETFCFYQFFVLLMRNRFEMLAD
jgi:hypothetical protein